MKPFRNVLILTLVVGLVEVMPVRLLIVRVRVAGLAKLIWLLLSWTVLGMTVW